MKIPDGSGHDILHYIIIKNTNTLTDTKSAGKYFILDVFFNKEAVSSIFALCKKVRITFNHYTWKIKLVKIQSSWLWMCSNQS